MGLDKASYSTVQYSTGLGKASNRTKNIDFQETLIKAHVVCSPLLFNLAQLSYINMYVMYLY